MVLNSQEGEESKGKYIEKVGRRVHGVPDSRRKSPMPGRKRKEKGFGERERWERERER